MKIDINQDTLDKLMGERVEALKKENKKLKSALERKTYKILNLTRQLDKARESAIRPRQLLNNLKDIVSELCDD